MFHLKVIAISLAILQVSSQRRFHRRQSNFNRGQPHFNPGPSFFNPRPPPFNPAPQQPQFNPAHQQPQFNPAHQQPQFNPSFQSPFNQFLPPQAPFLPTPPETIPSLCPSVEIFNRTADGWHGCLVLTQSSDTKGALVEVTFDDFVTAFVNNFGHASSKDNRVFVIKDQNIELKRGQELRIEIFVKSSNQFQFQTIKSLSLNGVQVCNEDEFAIRDPVETSCAKFEMRGNGTGGRWDGVLTVHPQFSSNGIRVDIELDEPAWALGNDLGETKTFDQKRFMIFGRRNVRSGTSLSINFFVKFDELEAIPQIKSILIDGVPICMSSTTSQPVGVIKQVEISTSSPPLQSGLLLSHLPFQQFPSVTQTPAQVSNNNFECGLSGNSIQNRFSRGVEAENGQFPFHVAIYRDQVYRCGGSLISSTTVITACHCVVKENRELFPKEDFRLLFGAIDLKSLSGSEALREVEEIIKHPDYEFDKILKQDIALIMIKGNLQLSMSIRPICLFDYQTQIANYVNQSVTILGFGSSEVSKAPNRFLNFGQMSIISRQQCIESKLVFGLLPEDSAFCAKAFESMIACPGDSGGALIMILNGKYYLRGVSSVTITDADGNCDSTQSVAFTDVSYFLPWIRQNMKGDENDSRRLSGI